MPSPTAPPVEWDVVVVGAGASGCALAARLTERGRQVLLVEAGAVPASPEGFAAPLLDATGVRGIAPGSGATWTYRSRLTADRDWDVVRGRVLGGSTTVNGAYFIRATPSDHARWARADPAWSWERALPVWRRLERDLDLGATPVHGDAGPMPVRREPLGAVGAALAAAGARLGHPAEPDKNGGGAPGVGPVPSNAVDGTRVNAGIAYALPAVASGLTIAGGTRALRVVVEGGRAVGVEVESRGERRVERAAEVVLSAGAIATPALLLASGVGPADELRATGVRVVHDAPGVGRGQSDHPQLVVEWAPRAPVPSAPGTWMAAALTTPDADGAVEVLASTRSMSELVGGSTDPLAPRPLLVSVQAPDARGSLRLRSADPRDAPLLAHRYLETDAQRAAMRGAARLALDLLATPEFAAVSAGVHPMARATDSELDAWIAATLGTSFHTCGGAAFDTDGPALAVTHPDGRVRGVPGLRVADLSLLPVAPTRGPAATAVFIGELVADAMTA